MKIKRKIIALMSALLIVSALLSGCGIKDNGRVIDHDPFYSLQAAYNNGWLTRDDLIKSVQTFHGETEQDAIDETLAEEIKKAYLTVFAREDLSVDDVIIERFYGTYGASAAVMITSIDMAYTLALWSETVGGETFHYGDGRRIYIYRSIRASE